MGDRIKLVEVIDNLEPCGAQRVMYDVVRNLSKEKFDITIICQRRTDKKKGESQILEKQILDEGFNVVFLAWQSKIKFIELYLTLNRIKPDIIHAHQWGVVASLWGNIHEVKTLLTIHTSPEVAIKGFAKKVLDAMLPKHCVVLVAISKYNEMLCRKHWNLKDDEVFYVNNGVELDHYSHKTHSGFSFINTGRQDKNKNQILILKAFSKLVKAFPSEQFYLYLVGDGSENKNLRGVAKQMSIEQFVVFIGYAQDVSQYLAKSDVYVSSAFREGLSISALEGMAAALPVIATDAGGVRDLAQENGILIKKDDVNAMFLAMKTLYSDNTLWNKKSEESLKMVKDYSMEQFVSEYENLFEKFRKKR